MVAPICTGRTQWGRPCSKRTRDPSGRCNNHRPFELQTTDIMLARDLRGSVVGTHTPERARATQLIYNMTRTFRLSPNTVFLAIGYYDRVCEIKDLPPEWMAAACLLLAAKWEDQPSYPYTQDVMEFLRSTQNDRGATIQNIIDAEKTVWVALGFNLNMNTPYTALHALPCESDEVRARAERHLLDQALRASPAMHPPPSLRYRATRALAWASRSSTS